MGKIKIGPSSESTIIESKVDVVAPSRPEIIYVDKPIIQEVEKIVVQEKPVIQEKIVYVDKPMIEYIEPKNYDEQIEILSHDLQEVEDLCHSELHSINMQLGSHESRLHEMGRSLLEKIQASDLKIIKILLGISLILNIINLLWR